MPELAEDKTRKLLMALELLAISVAAVLILIDYKLKRDLLELFARIESAIETGNRIYGTDTDHAGSDNPVPGSFVVGDHSPVETTDVPSTANGHSKAREANGRFTTAHRDGRTGNTPVPDPDKPVGT